MDLAVLSLGVPTDIPQVKRLYELGISVWGEVELAYQVGKGTVLAITGTNGKTTTTALLGKIMADHQDSVFVVGNIGNAYTSAASQMKEESVTVAEISSFQLETIETFAPHVSAILNITEDPSEPAPHDGRVHQSKELITKNQGCDDYCILNYEDEILRKFWREFNAEGYLFFQRQGIRRRNFLRDGRIILRLDKKEIPFMKTQQLRILDGTTMRMQWLP